MTETETVTETGAETDTVAGADSVTVTVTDVETEADTESDYRPSPAGLSPTLKTGEVPRHELAGSPSSEAGAGACSHRATRPLPWMPEAIWIKPATPLGTPIKSPMTELPVLRGMYESSIGGSFSSRSLLPPLVAMRTPPTANARDSVPNT